MTDVIDGVVVDAPSRELAVRLHDEIRHEVIRPLDPMQVVDSMRTHQELLQRILDPSDWQGQPDRPGSFVKKSGWRKIALAYNLALGRVAEEVERDGDGMPRRATYTAYAQAPNGRRVEASGHCSYDESRFSGPRGNASKLENDMRATAETRAKNRAVSDLIGMGRVSAEEVDAGTPAGPPFGPAVNEAQGSQLRRAISYVLDEPASPVAIDGVIDEVIFSIRAKSGGYIPVIAMQAIGLLAAAVKAQRETQAASFRRAVDAEVDAMPSDDELIDQALREREEATS
jgi:hypothetical protein